MDIEGIAVQRVKREILKYDCLKDYINTNDKTPMWDGEIYIYKENSKYKASEDFLGKISVQVKGHKVNKLKSGNSKYLFEWNLCKFSIRYGNWFSQFCSFIFYNWIY